MTRLYRVRAGTWRFWPLGIGAKLAVLFNLKEGSLKARFVYGSAWSLIGVLLPRAFTIATTIMVARMLGIDGYGQLGIIQSTIGMFAFVSSASMTVTAIKHVAEFKDRDKAKAGRIIGLTQLTALTFSIVTALALVVTVEWLSNSNTGIAALKPLMQISAITVVFSALTGAQIGIMNGLEAFRRVALITTVQSIVALPITIGLVWVLGLAGSVWALVATGVMGWSLNEYALARECSRHQIKINFRDSWSERTILWRFSLAHILATSLSAPTMWYCNTLLVGHPNGYQEMGLFNAAFRWRDSLLLVPGVLGNAAMPLHSERLGSRDTRSVIKLLLTSLVAVAVVVLPIASILVLLSTFIMSQYGSEFSSSGGVLVVITTAAAVQALGVPLGNFISATGETWASLMTSALVSLTMVLVARSAVQDGAIGLANAYLAAYGVGFVTSSLLALFILWRRIGSTGRSYVKFGARAGL